jgi:hypothetical protein
LFQCGHGRRVRGGTFQQGEGLVCYYNSVKFHYLHLSRDETSGKHLRVMSCVPDSPQTDAFTPPIGIPAGRLVHLRVGIDYERLHFAYRVKGVDKDRHRLLRPRLQMPAMARLLFTVATAPPKGRTAAGIAALSLPAPGAQEKDRHTRVSLCDSRNSGGRIRPHMRRPEGSICRPNSLRP